VILLWCGECLRFHVGFMGEEEEGQVMSKNRVKTKHFSCHPFGARAGAKDGGCPAPSASGLPAAGPGRRCALSHAMHCRRHALRPAAQPRMPLHAG
jgi:hypothetical protein